MKKAVQRTFTIAASVCIFFSLSGKSQAPAKWKTGMELNAYNGGGRTPQSTTVIINKTSCTYIDRQQQARDTLRFKLSQAELDKLLKEITACHFMNMLSGRTKSIRYDMATTSIEFGSGNKTHKVSIGATEQITRGAADDFNRLYAYIMTLTGKKTGQKTE